MIKDLKFENILFLDIETVPAYPSFNKLPERFKKLWQLKADKLQKSETDTVDILYPRAGIYAEFGRIIVISVAFLRDGKLRIKSYYGHDEKKLLLEFKELLEVHFNRKEHLLCAHNGKEFDFPYIARRMVVNGISLPDILNSAGKKPWEVNHLDTMELWKFGDYKNYTSLDLLTAIFEIPSPKDDISGADVWKVYWQENDLERIKTYCQKDVITIVQVLCKYQNIPLLEESNFIFV